MPTVLPALDPDPAGRTAALDMANRAYTWDHTFVPAYGMLYEPGTRTPNLVQALTEGKLHQLPKEEIPAKDDVYMKLREQTAEPALVNTIHDFVLRVTVRINDLDDYRSFVQKDRPLPVVAPDAEDRYFAWQRLAGPNPLSIRRIDAPPSSFAVNDARLAGVLPEGHTLASLAAAGRLYLCDYAVLEDIPLDTYNGTTKTVTPAKGLFASLEGGLTPLAVQLDQLADPERVWTPKDARWPMARLVLNAADVNYHEMVSHLGHTHFTQEGVAVVTHRTLSDRHPLFKLLAPHLRWLLFNNFEGRELLMDPGGWAGSLLAGGLPGNDTLLLRSRLGYAAREVAPFDILDWDLPADLRRRGVDDTNALPVYPYRDDGLPVWRAIGAFVRAYVDLYYATDAAVASDPEVQAWGWELAAPRGAGLRGLDPRMDTRAAVALMLQRILWSCGPLHSAVNYPQWEFFADVARMPAALYDRPWERDGDVDTAALIRMLPPEKQVSLQVFTVATLTAFRPSELGHYAQGDLDDPAALRLVAEFQLALREAGHHQKDADASRPWRYPYLNPTNVLNSTSI